MKKLMTVAVAALGAVFAHGATVAWTITNVNGPNGSSLSTGSAYVFFVQQSSGKADTSEWAGLKEKGATAMLAALADANFSYTSADITADPGTWSYNSATVDASALKTNSELGLAGSTKYSVYAVIFDSTTITDESKYMVTAATTAATTYSDSAGTTKSFAIGSQSTASATWYAVGTSSVPEPTSGLLMLLGVAGLALKRKSV